MQSEYSPELCIHFYEELIKYVKTEIVFWILIKNY